MNRNLFLVICCLIWTFSQGQDTLIAPQEEPRQSLWKDLAHDGGNVLRGVGHFYTAPAHWDKQDAWVAAGVATGTAVLWLADEPINDYFTNQAAGVPQGIKDAGFYFGKPLYNYGLTGGIYAVGLFTRNEKLRHTGVLIISSNTAAGLLQTFLKTAVGRARPYSGKGSAAFKPFASEEYYHSFPSGHAILSFTTAYAISKQFESPWIKGGIWALGLVTPVSRMWAGAHWASDVGFGIMLSVITVESIDRFLKKRESDLKDPSKKKISWNLNFTGKTIGVTGTF